MASKGKAPKLTKFADIVGGRIDFQIQGRVINLWTTPDRFNAAEAGSMHMILLDNQGVTIHASVRKHLVPIFKDQFEEGSIYVIEKLMVAQNDPTFKTTPHKYKLNLMRGTTIFKLKDSNEIPKRHFQFMSFLEIMACHKEDRLIDVIGHVVEKDELKVTEKNGKTNKVMDATLEDLEGNRIHCTLWEDYAEQLKRFLESHDPKLPVVVLIQMCKLKKYFGAMGISNAFYGTKLLFDVEIPEVASYLEKMNEAHVELTQVVSQMSGPIVVPLADDLLCTPRMTIEDLIESSEKCVGTVLARTCELESDVGWFYRACTKCASRVTVINGQIYCDKCSMPRTAVPRFKVHIQVIDNTGSTTFILFDRIVAQGLGRSAQDLVDAIAERNADSIYPEELNLFVDKRMLFKVEVNESNLYRNWRSYTVKKMTTDDEIITRFISHHGINPGNHEEEAEYVEAVSKLADNQTVDVSEGTGSNNKDENMAAEPVVTPTSKRLGKRGVEHVDSLDDIVVGEVGSLSYNTRPSKRINISPIDLDAVSFQGLDIFNEIVDMECRNNGEDSDIPSDSDFDIQPADVNTFSDITSSGSGKVEYLNIGHPDRICEDCGAMMWYHERTKKAYNPRKPKFSLCCRKGRVEIAPYPRLPQPLHDLYHKLDRKSKFFLANIRSFNSMFSFTSMGGKVNRDTHDGHGPPMFVMEGENYHQIGSLLPMPGKKPKFAQLYIYDTDNEINNRLASVSMDEGDLEIKTEIVRDIRDVLDSCNPYVETYRTIRERINENDSPPMRLRILRKRGRDGRRYNLPTASEVAALIVGDFDSADFDRDVIVETQSGLLQRISVFEPAYLPLQYPLLFPKGEDGFRRDIPYNENADATQLQRLYVTQKEWISYKIMQRETDQSTILFARRLFQQFSVDSFSCLESSRLRWLKDHQKEVRAEMYKGITEAILRGDTDPSTTGKRIVLPSTFVGGSRYMLQNYQDAMAICGWAGYPDLFITFTCNQKWPELVEFLKIYHQKPEDRPDLVSRIFKIKLDDLIKEIKIGELFGEVKSVNSDECMMTRMQEMSLDYHFTVEQEVGSSTYAFFGFNGTAGVWRISALNEAGGWKDRTTVEDMDLAVRASLKGWKFLYLSNLKVKNELPSTFKAYRYQQHRWSCGPANLFRKMVLEIIQNKKVSLWKKIHVIYSFFFVRKVIAHINTFVFYCIVLPATVLVPEVAVPKWGAVYIPSVITLLNAVGTPRSLHLLVFWILFENVMSLHRAKATVIGLLEASRVNEWIVTEKLGDALKAKAGTKALKKPRFRIEDRIHLLELGVGMYLFFIGCYDVMFGKNHFFIFLFIQAIAFFIMAFGYVGTFVPNS